MNIARLWRFRLSRASSWALSLRVGGAAPAADGAKVPSTDMPAGGEGLLQGQERVQGRSPAARPRRTPPAPVTRVQGQGHVLRQAGLIFQR